MTTNHPETLDPALIRPGRVDYEVQFEKSRGEDIKDLLRYFYSSDYNTDTDDTDTEQINQTGRLPKNLI